LGVDAAGQPPAYQKKKIAKKPIGVKLAHEDVKTLYSLINNNNNNNNKCFVII
jgi:hypothetical protein